MKSEGIEQRIVLIVSLSPPLYFVEKEAEFRMVKN